MKILVECKRCKREVEAKDAIELIFPKQWYQFQSKKIHFCRTCAIRMSIINDMKSKFSELLHGFDDQFNVKKESFLSKLKNLKFKLKKEK